MKHKKMTAMILLMLCFVLFPMTAHGAGENVLIDDWDCIDSLQSKSYSFNMPVEGRISLDFTGYESRSGNDKYISGTYGDYRLEFIDATGTVVWTIEDYSGYDDKSYQTTLAAGNYSLVITEIDDYELDYILEATWEPSEAITPTSLSISKTELELKKGNSEELAATKEPSYAQGAIIWSSSNEKVVTVDENGEVTATGYGTAIITAQCGNLTEECTVTVKKILATKLSLDRKKLSMKKGDGYILTADTEPWDMEEKITWKSSNPKVAKVKVSDGGMFGLVEAKKMGKTTITVKCGKFTKKCNVTVNKATVEMWSGKTKNLSSFVKHIQGYKKAKWTSSKSSVVKVSKNGKITSKKHGKALIKCKIKGVTYTFTVYSYSAKKLKAKGKETLNDLLKFPGSLSINEIGYGTTFGTMYIDYSAMNGFGGYNRDDFWFKYQEGKFYYYSDKYGYVTVE